MLNIINMSSDLMVRPHYRSLLQKTKNTALQYITRDGRCSVIFHINFLAACMAAYFWNSYTDSYYLDIRIAVWNVSKFSLVRDLWVFKICSYYFLNSSSFFNTNFGTWFNILSFVWSLSNLAHSFLIRFYTGVFS